MRIGCNAVLYNTRAGWCTLLKHETPTLPVTVEQYESRLMFLLHLTLPWDVKVNTVVIKVTHNISYELRAESRATADTRAVTDPRTEQRGQTSTVIYVHLYRYMEVCKVNVIHNRIIENVTSIQMISNVRSVNRCLHFCRPWFRQLFYCAIIYTRHNYQCELLIRNTERSNAYFVDGENNLIELLNCYPVFTFHFHNRKKLILNKKRLRFYIINFIRCKSILFAAYLKDVQMTCVLDQLKLSSSSLVLYEMRILWGKSFDECILMCNSLRPENKCNAIKYYQNLKKCYLLAAHINSITTETQHGSYYVIIIYGCLKGSYYLHEIENYSMLVLGGTFISLQIEILNKTLIIERRPTVDNRQSERRNNPPPMRYYLKETGDICVLEFYNATQLSGFNPIETLENVENVKSCIYACRLRYSSYTCLAINYTMKKQCTLLQQESNHEIYNVESQSLFAEILFCEPGTFADEIYDF
ncbi:hypothetical protein T11_5738 [Trichinella zimbabwensis]|uniref:Apple domain-containing protein n=1 Tax=Trichinella zimbabwensis TaxID=268475 RepID=A0A0V1I5B7_9BILA|nr:hypothetical protein T11_5738 [Trichinella zimbabwensis]